MLSQCVQQVAPHSCLTALRYQIWVWAWITVCVERLCTEASTLKYPTLLVCCNLLVCVVGRGLSHHVPSSSVLISECAQSTKAALILMYSQSFFGFACVSPTIQQPSLQYVIGNSVHRKVYSSAKVQHWNWWVISCIFPFITWFIYLYIIWLCFSLGILSTAYGVAESMPSCTAGQNVFLYADFVMFK